MSEPSIDIEAFQRIFREHCSIEPSEVETREWVSTLLDFYELMFDIVSDSAAAKGVFDTPDQTTKVNTTLDTPSP